jgi:hypothetical protein
MKKTLAIGVTGAMMTIAPAHSQSIPDSYFRDTQNSVYLMGQPPGSEATLTYANLAKSRTITTDNCGRVIWRASTTNPVPANYSFTADGLVFSTTAGVPTAELTRCNPDGRAADNGTAGIYRTAKGDFVLGGQTRNVPFQLFYKVQKSRKVKANVCGVARWGNTTTTPHDGNTVIQLQGQNVYLTGLESLKPPVCRLGQLYIPAEWLGGAGGGGGS